MGVPEKVKLRRATGTSHRLQIANENGLPLECVRKIADRLGEREDFGALILICEGRGARNANQAQANHSRANYSRGHVQ